MVEEGGGLAAASAVVHGGDASEAAKALGGSAAAAVEEEGPFSPMIRQWAELLDEVEAAMTEAIVADFTSAARGYLSQRRDFRLVPAGPAPASASVSATGGASLPSENAADAAARLDLSPALCEPISRLNAELHGLRQSLPPSSLRRVWPPVAAAVDELLYSQLVRRSTFSSGGARQLHRDVSALVALFHPLTPNPHASLRRLHESVQLLTLDGTTRRALTNDLLGDTPPQPQRDEHEAGLRRRLEQLCGVYRLTLGEVVELLTSLVDEEDEAGGGA